MRRSFFLAISAIVLLSCTDEDTTSITPPQQSTITIAPSISDTRGSLIYDESSMGSMGVYCAKTGDEPWSTESEFTKMENNKYIYSGSRWIADGDEELWEQSSPSDKYTFFAYSPYESTQYGIKSYINEGELNIEYNVPMTCIYQPDLLIAAPRKDIFPQLVNGVSLSFKHALATICFSRKSSVTDSITQISIGKVISKGVLSWDYGTSSPYWDTTNSPVDTFTAQLGSEIPDSSGDNIQLTASNGYLMMIPQVLASDVEVVVEMKGGKSRTLSIAAGTQWECGKQYNYLIDEEKDYVEVVYNSSQQSNCYIVHPSNSKRTIIQIPIEDRINYFWETYESETKITCDTKTKNLYAALLWEDLDEEITDYSFEIVRDKDAKMAVRVTLPVDVSDGNFVFTVNSSKNDNVLWSWHLWITDYDPDGIVRANATNIEPNSNMVYSVSGKDGVVHRYKDYESCGSDEAMWDNEGIYAHKFIMDRNIGARSSEQESSDCAAGIIYYQFGRKDPFPLGTMRYATGETSTMFQYCSAGSFSDVVQTPGKFFYRTGIGIGDNLENFSWCVEDDAYRTDILWYDRALGIDGYKTGKSIFDPSPLGWRVPVYGTWNNLEGSGGLPAGDADCKTVSNFPKYGFVLPQHSDMYIQSWGNWRYLWSATPYKSKEVKNGYMLLLKSSKVDKAFYNSMGAGAPVRAVME